jgi:hypothetical protein
MIKKMFVLSILSSFFIFSVVAKTPINLTSKSNVLTTEMVDTAIMVDGFDLSIDSVD